mmetsp:Transcript_41219/g.98710  ORF Transcript_41219/g.98710 Transcript_41219/m.98710 type:complete len:260 (+) Transcript_41219:265-1044(+)
MGNIIGMVQSFFIMLPHPIGSYCQHNLDTIPKVLNHTLIGLACSNLFLMFNAMAVSSITFFASLLLVLQTSCVIVVTNHAKFASFVPRSFEPSGFMVGMCLGLCIGGVILAFFLSVTFRRAFAFCKFAEENYEESDHAHACPGNFMHRCWSLWWWSSLVFWLDLLTAVLIAAGRPELSLYDSGGSSQQAQYQSIGSSSIGADDSTSLNSGVQPFQHPELQQPQQQQQQQQQQPSTMNNSLGGYSDNSFSQPSTAHVIGV